MSDPHQDFISLALSRQVVSNALRVALIVGTILALINHGGKIFALSLTTESLLKILLTYFVPYCVSTYSAVKALQARTEQASRAKLKD
ncbi:MAG: nitrate/nitrite transporter NrtS [Halioglobus sp.]